MAMQDNSMSYGETCFYQAVDGSTCTKLRFGVGQLASLSFKFAMKEASCEVSSQAISDHFVDVNKMVDLGSGSQRVVGEIMLTNSQFPKFLEMMS